MTVDLKMQVTSLNPSLQFMICTVYDEDEKVFQALEAGAHAYMLKSSEFDFLAPRQDCFGAARLYALWVSQ